jgi:hypothetical protein
MPRFSLKDILLGITAASIGFGMLAVAFHGGVPAASEKISVGQAFLVAFGGALAGYGLAFPFKWPPHQMISAMVGMFAAQAWQTGSSFGLIFYVCVMALFGGVGAIRKLRAKREGEHNSPPSARS